MLQAVGKAFEQSEIVTNIRETQSGKSLPLEIIKFLVLVFTADAITNRFAVYVLNYKIEPLASLWGIWLIAIGLLSFVAIGYVMLWEDLRPHHIGVCSRPWQACVRNFAIGYVLGAVVMSVAVIVATLLGGYAIAENFQQARAGSIVLMALIYVFQAFGEEVLYRGAGLMCMSRKSSPVVALVASSVIFTLHHYHNPGYGPIAFVNIFLLGVLCGVSVFATSQIWMATAIHAAWNFIQGNIYGVNVTGSVADATDRLLTATANDMPLITGGQMGLEGSLVTTVVLLVSIGLFAWRVVSQSRQSENAQVTGASR